MPKVYNRIEKICKLLKAYSTEHLYTIENLEYVECGYKENNIPPETGWEPMSYLIGTDKHFWVRGSFKTPSAEPGTQIQLRFSHGKDLGRDATRLHGLLYLNGEMVHGIDVNHGEVWLEPNKQYQMYYYVYSAWVAGPYIVNVELERLDVETEGLYYDILTPLEALSVLNENTGEYQNTLSALEQTVNLIDLRQPHSDTYRQSILEARAFIQKEFYEKLCSTQGKPVVHCIGHTHIDVEWLWARKQTREKMQRSFSTAKALMDQYPEYLFTLSQPELYRYLKEEAPEKYQELKNLIAAGRWEPEGAMWVECDCNVTGGESFIRQILQGKNFFRKEFGKESKVLFLPDVFGYSAALPQILKKSGVDYFVTSKISWNDTNTVPYDTFMWQGIDGTEILTDFITARKASVDHVTNRVGTYVGHIDAPFVLGCWDRYLQKEFNDNTIITFGYGDGGGGPNRVMLEKQRRLAKGLPGLPVTKMNFLLPFLKDVEKSFQENCKKLRRTPRWVGELYLEYHRGTYTSVAKNKRNNRKSELALQKTEALSYTDLFFGGSYDAEGIYHTWRKVLHNQFHDILPGSSVHTVYEGTDVDYKKILGDCSDWCRDKLKALASQVNTRGGILVYNPLGFARKGIVSVAGKTVELKEEIPAFGWRVIPKAEVQNCVQVNGLTAENVHYRINLDEAGRIVSLLDKAANREIILPGQCANEFQVFDDQPDMYDAWEIRDYYKSRMYVLDEPAKITAITDGSRSGFCVEKTYCNSTLKQNIWLYSQDRRIDFETEIDWHETYQLMKVAFPIDVHTDRAAYEIQFGHVYRPTHSNTSWDAAKFEVCAHKWADVSENGYGVSLLNDCKYGFNTEGSTMKLTVLKSALRPAPDVNQYADQGKHVLAYSLLPHSGSLYDADTPKNAYSFNQPLEAMEISTQTGNLPEAFSMVSCQGDNVIAETVKKAENSDDMIVRLYEAFNSRGNVVVTVPDGFRQAFLCDLMENELTQLDFADNKVSLMVKNFEIVTLKFKR